MKNNGNMYLFLLKLAIFIIILSESVFFINYGLDDTFELIGYSILLICIIYSFFKHEKKKTKLLFSFLVFLLLTSVGFLIQDLTLKRKVILLFTTFTIAVVTHLSNHTIENDSTIKELSYTIFYSIIIASVLAIFSGIGIKDPVDSTSGGIIPISFGLNFGIHYKNYFAADMIAVFIGIYNYYKYHQKNKKDTLFLLIVSFMIIMSNSKGGILLFVIVLLAFKFDMLEKLNKYKRQFYIVLLFVIGLITSIYIYNNVILNISTYAYRYRGLINFLDYFSKDKYHLMYGISSLVYDKNLSYVMTVRSMTGFDGSLEMAWLNILIKSGIVGVVGYFILFAKYVVRTIKEKDFKYKTKQIVIIVVLLFSSLVEAYIQSVHCIFAIFLYLLFNSKISQVNNNEK